jgi:hypothetical protein
MELFALAWRILLDGRATPYLVPLPWHLLAVLVLLGLLAAGGVHHLVGYTYRFYRIGERVSPLLAVPSLFTLLATVLVLLGAYLLAGTGSQMASVAVNAPGARAAAGPIGAYLLAPAFHHLYGELEEGVELDRAMLTRGLLAFSEEELQEGFRRELEALQAAGNDQAAPAPEPVEGGEAQATSPAPAEPIPPEGTEQVPRADQPPPSGSGDAEQPAPPDEVEPVPQEQAAAREPPHRPPALLVLTLRWLVDVHEDWPPLPPAVAASPPEQAEAPTEEAQRERPEAERQATGQEQPEPQAEQPGQPAPEPQAQQSPQDSPEPPEQTPPAGRNGEEEPAQPLVARHILALVGEIQLEAVLSRSDWEHVAGNRFLERVVEPLLAWQIGYLAAMLLVLAVITNALVFFALRQLRHWLTGRGASVPAVR